MRLATLATMLLLIGVSSGCAQHEDTQGEHTHGVYLAQGEWVDVSLQHPEGFKQVGIFYDAADATIWYRAGLTVSDLGEWKKTEVTWSEDVHHVGRVMLDQSATVLELRSDSVLEMGHVQFYPEVVGAKKLTRDFPKAQTTSLINGFAPSSLVVTRAAWGARNVDRVCGITHDVYRITVHHTAGPVDDGNDAAARMRQIQAYHVDSNGWCDVGYHFVVSQGGQIFQGANEERTGAHVLNHNVGNIGISLIGNFEEQTPGQAQLDATAEIMGWAAKTYGVPFTTASIKGHNQWPGTATACPGTNLLSRLNTIIAAAGDVEVELPEPDTYDAEINVSMLSGGEDFYQDGTSQGVLDVLPNDEVEVEIRIKNTSTLPLGGVVVGYGIASEFVTAVDYRIESDSPSFNGSTFVLNDANDAPQNPAKADFGGQGKLVMYAFAPGETKRVVVKLKAIASSVGSADHPGLRAWVNTIEDVYSVQNAFDSQPSGVNLIGRLLQDLVEVDVLSRDQWQFNSSETTDTEGWFACGESTESLVVSGGALNLTGSGVCGESPAWTQIDASKYDQMVVRLSAIDSSWKARIHWASEGDDTFVGGLVFDVIEAEDTYVISLGESDFWRGAVDGLRLSFQGEGTVGIDSVFFQNSDGETSTEDPVVDKKPTPTETPERPVVVRPLDDSTTESGCSSASQRPTNLVWLGLLGFVGLMRRRRQ